MTKKVLAWIAQENLIRRHATVLVGVSGGADSICLLLMLWQQRSELAIRVVAVHVEHGIRGEESVADAVFVRNLCARFEIPLESFSVSVPAYAKEQGIGLEEAARILRYDCYRRLAARHAAAGEPVEVALAHHANDNAETMLFQMVRGSGIEGMAGMRPKRELAPGIFLIRPLLAVTREEIEDWLARQRQEYRTDSTNADRTYSRNRIRGELIPALKEINAQAIRHMNETARQMREISDYLDERERELLCAVRESRTGGFFLRQELKAAPLLLQRKVIYTTLSQAAGSRRDWGSVHVEAVLALFLRQNGRRLSLPYGLTAYREYEGVFIGSDLRQRNRDAGFLPAEVFRIPADLEETQVLLPDGCRLTAKKRIFSGKMEEIPKNKYTKWYDYDKIRGSLQIRTRKSGDYLVIYDAHGVCHRKKLKDYFITEKVPVDLRDGLWLLTEGAHVLWILGGRGSEAYRVTEETKAVIEISMNGDTNENKGDQGSYYGRGSRE